MQLALIVEIGGGRGMSWDGDGRERNAQRPKMPYTVAERADHVFKCP
jgi:hypothetical protein